MLIVRRTATTMKMRRGRTMFATFTEESVKGPILRLSRVLHVPSVLHVPLVLLLSPVQPVQPVLTVSLVLSLSLVLPLSLVLSLSLVLPRSLALPLSLVPPLSLVLHLSLVPPHVPPAGPGWGPCATSSFSPLPATPQLKPPAPVPLASWRLPRPASSTSSSALSTTLSLLQLTSGSGWTTGRWRFFRWLLHLTFSASEGSFTFSEGEELLKYGQVTSWRPGQPSAATAGGEDCVSVDKDGKWDDVDCTGLRNYLCQTPAI